MGIDGSFQVAYRELEQRMKARAEADGDVFVPSAEPDEPVSYVLICMEPSFSWARSAEEGRRKVERGFPKLSGLDGGLDPALLRQSVFVRAR
jgi:hypothetical protein